MLKPLNQILLFGLELVMLGAFAYFGFQKGESTLMKYVLAILLPLFAVLLWDYFAAPKSLHRLSMLYLALFRAALFLIASYFLYRIDKPNADIVMALFSVGTQVAGYFLDDYARPS